MIHRLNAGAILVFVAALQIGPPPVFAGADLIAGFHSVVGTSGARAIWVNPAAIGGTGRPTAVAESMWRRDAAPGDDADWEEMPAAWSLAASMDRSAYAWQKEGEDIAGVADWAIAWGERRRTPGGGAFGASIEWRGGEEKTLDGTVGVLLPLGRVMTGGAVLDNVREGKVDGVDRERSWRTGLAWTPRDLPGRVTWDTLWESDRRGDTAHWFGIAFDRTQRFRLAWHGNLDDEWSGALGVVAGSAVFEGGWRKLPGDGDRDGAWIALEWSGPQFAGKGWGPIPR